MKKKFVIAVLLLPFILSAGDFNIDFAEGRWDKSQWTPLLVFPVKHVKDYVSTPVQFAQKPDCISVGFSEDILKASLDNALMVIDTKNTEGQFEAVFGMDDGNNTAPGFCISPYYGEDKVLEKGICVFVANYTMAVWYFEADRAKNTMKYTHLARLIRWNDPTVKHVFRYRHIKDRFLVQVDNSDILMVSFPAGFKPNPQIGVWGCHGRCDFFSLNVKAKGDMPIKGTKPEKLSFKAVKARVVLLAQADDAPVVDNTNAK